MGNRQWTEVELRALYEWQKRRRQLIEALRDLGTDESKAAELGISRTNFSTLLWRARNRFEEQHKGVYADIATDVRRRRIERALEALKID